MSTQKKFIHKKANNTKSSAEIPCIDRLETTMKKGFFFFKPVFLDRKDVEKHSRRSTLCAKAMAGLEFQNLGLANGVCVTRHV